MIKKKTVLVLGAGASCHLGFPLGQKLIEEVYRFVHGQTQGIRNTGTSVPALRGEPYLVEDRKDNSVLLERFLGLAGYKKDNDQEYSSKDIIEFAENLHRAQPPSIDFFLETNPQYSLLGKICIIFCLSRHEDQYGWYYLPSRFPDKLKDNYPDHGWYRYLWHRLVEGCKTFEDFQENKISIITFNYDRSLEYYLMEAIKSFFDVEELQAMKAVNVVKINHVYGKLGKLDWEIDYLQDGSYKSPEDCLMERAPFIPCDISCFFRLMGDIGKYGMTRGDFKKDNDVLSQKSRDQLVKKFKRTAQEIKNFYEATEGQNKSEYFDLFREVEKVYFLGFGYHDLNIKALGLDLGVLSDDVVISGTAIEKTDRETEEIRHYVASFSRPPDQVNIRNNWNGMGDSEASKIISFFRNVEPLE
jgi:hypothetical protein